MARWDPNKHPRHPAGTEDGGEFASGGTMADAIALSSPSGRMSKRARAAAQERLRVKLFGKEGLQGPDISRIQETEQANNLRRAADLRALADRGMNPIKYRREAERLERLAGKKP